VPIQAIVVISKGSQVAQKSESLETGSRGRISTPIRRPRIRPTTPANILRDGIFVNLKIRIREIMARNTKIKIFIKLFLSDKFK